MSVYFPVIAGLCKSVLRREVERASRIIDDDDGERLEREVD